MGTGTTEHDRSHDFGAKSEEDKSRKNSRETPPINRPWPCSSSSSRIARSEPLIDRTTILTFLTPETLAGVIALLCESVSQSLPRKKRTNLAHLFRLLPAIQG